MGNYYDNQNASAPGIALAHAVNGELVGGRQGVPQGGNVQLATQYSTAPYKPPKVAPARQPAVKEKAKRVPAEHCREEGCKGYVSKKYAAEGHFYCMGHLWGKGIVERVNLKAEPDGDTD
jgi:hypothetical protein